MIQNQCAVCFQPMNLYGCDSCNRRAQVQRQQESMAAQSASSPANGARIIETISGPMLVNDGPECKRCNTSYFKCTCSAQADWKEKTTDDARFDERVACAALVLGFKTPSLVSDAEENLQLIAKAILARGKT